MIRKQFSIINLMRNGSLPLSKAFLESISKTSKCFPDIVQSRKIPYKTLNLKKEKLHTPEHIIMKQHGKKRCLKGFYFF